MIEDLVILGACDLAYLLRDPTQIWSDNKGCADWSKSASAKAMRHENIRENRVREAQQDFKEILVDYISGKLNPSDIMTKEHKDRLLCISWRAEAPSSIMQKIT